MTGAAGRAFWIWIGSPGDASTCDGIGLDIGMGTSAPTPWSPSVLIRFAPESAPLLSVGILCNNFPLRICCIAFLCTSLLKCSDTFNKGYQWSHNGQQMELEISIWPAGFVLEALFSSSNLRFTPVPSLGASLKGALADGVTTVAEEDSCTLRRADGVGAGGLMAGETAGGAAAWLDVTCCRCVKFGPTCVSKAPFICGWGCACKSKDAMGCVCGC
mmetsp:Transcript_1425/g.2170  ORF Transcript_1425/g.2170 Transcript_1425/m.2170 type:complete len:216 (-) Transcript_1425:592-1239(-)